MVINRSLDIDYILKNHLAVCRDYSKFTACLLLNLYPDADIYFVFAPGHVAPGIKLNDKIYILDQTLPISTLEKWGNFYNKGSTKYKTLKIVEEQNSKFLNLSNNAYFDASTSNTTIDLEALSMKISNILAINNQSSGNKKFVKPLKNLKKFYEDDEVISYSLARAIKNRLSDELCGEIKRITKLEIKYNDDRESLPVLVCNFN
jgi:predicted transglutaminase-like protease